jgi:hypothetical protein
MSEHPYDELIRRTAAKYNLDPGRFKRQLIAESGLNPNARNPSGAAGIAQFMPATARGMGIDPMDPNQAIPAAGQLMRSHLNSYQGDYNKALAAYNWGPGNVQRKGMENMPAETRNYIQKITGGDSVAMGPVEPPEQFGPPQMVGPPPPPAQPRLMDPRLLTQTPSLGDIIASAAQKSMI